MAAALGLAAHAAAQIPAPSLPYTRTFDLLVADTTNDVVHRLSDFNQDGDYNDPGEVLLFYSGAGLSNPTGIACAPDGTAYVVDSSTDIVLALRDINYDGDCNSPGEAVVFFDSANNASGVMLGAAFGIAADQMGRVWVLTANQSSPIQGVDGIVKLEDLNGDGDANDLGEAVYFLQVPGSGGSLGFSNPSEFAIGFDGAFYLADAGSSVTKGIYRAFDADSSGLIDTSDPNEWSLWWVPPYVGTSPAWWGFAFDFSGHLYVANHGGGASVVKEIWRALDVDASGVIDAGEQQLAYAQPVAASATWWDMLRVDDGSFLLGNGSADNITRLRDLDFDGNFNGPGEAAVVFDKNLAGVPTLDIRAMAVYRAPMLEMSPSTIVIGGSTNFVVRAVKPFDITVTGASLGLIPPISLPPYGTLEIDPLSLIIFGTGLADAAGYFVSPLNFNNDPSLIGSYGCTALSGDFYRLFLSNGDLLTVTP
ncbi:MAG: hypothetical protein KF830_05390 [Planctomycetes bacterium]|nr:hypothetical protein [Planctomycetota bacterium]